MNIRITVVNKYGEFVSDIETPFTLTEYTSQMLRSVGKLGDTGAFALGGVDSTINHIFPNKLINDSFIKIEAIPDLA